jgi:hypothetical protein
MNNTVICNVMKGIDNLISRTKDENDTILEILRQLQSRIKNDNILHRGFVTNVAGIEVFVLANRIFTREGKKETTYKLDQLNMYEKDNFSFRLIMEGVMSGETTFGLIPNGWEIKDE